jgi:hypothetical protein
MTTRDHLLGLQFDQQTIDKFVEETDYLKKIAVDHRKNTYERVRAYCINHPGCAKVQVARALNLSQTQVYRAVEKLKITWKD